MGTVFLKLKSTAVPGVWRRFNGERLNGSLHDAVEEVIRREHQQGHRLKVCIGTDSQVFGKHTEFATVIVFLREKRGGFMFIHNEKVPHRHSVKERLLLEVSKSVEIAYSLCDLLDAYDVDLEVHADINTNPHFQSNAALHEAMGYILSMGFAFKAKPEAFASSCCANKVI
ncbi:MAG: ribonuclease H-like YkuK family protein [Chitinophagales bacterium]|nr:ribonuclease H-like YkuK family protein [Chitinophagales bacterium]MDW8427610.1 ribonuclease H-like YkuK family protein [Chitinophagales bacterium]